jgi:hypothetical protein
MARKIWLAMVIIRPARESIPGLISPKSGKTD